MHKERDAEIISAHNIETALNLLTAENCVGIPLDLRVSILKSAKNESETVIVLPENNIVLLAEKKGMVLKTPELNLTSLVESLPHPEMKIAQLVMDNEPIPPQSVYLFIPEGTDQALTINPLHAAPFKPADDVLASTPSDLQTAYKQIEASGQPLVIARHDIDEPGDPKRENRWVLLMHDDELYVTSPPKLSCSQTDFPSYVAGVLSTDDRLSNLDASDRQKLIIALQLEIEARAEVLLQTPESRSPVERARKLSAPVTKEDYQSTVETFYEDAGVSELFYDEVQRQHKGLQESTQQIIDEGQGYAEYVVRMQKIRLSRQEEYAERANKFRATFGDYGKHQCNLVASDNSCSCEISEKDSDKLVQVITIEESFGEESQRRGHQIVWRDADGEVVEKPLERRFIGPAQNLKAIDELRRRLDVEIQEFEPWKQQSMKESPLYLGYLSLPYNVRKTVSSETEDVESLTTLVGIHNADKILREKAKNIIQWLERTNDPRANSYRGRNGEMLPTVLILESEYNIAIEREHALHEKRSEITGKPPTYDAELFHKLLHLDPRTGVGSSEIVNLVEHSGVSMRHYDSVETLLADNPTAADKIGPGIDLEGYREEVASLYPEAITTQEEFEALLKKLPLTQPEYERFKQIAESGAKNIDSLARSLVLNAVVFWKNQNRSSEAQVSPEQTVDRVMKVQEQMEKGKPLQMSIYCALCEATHPFKVAQQHPDISEYYFMKKLVTMSRVASLIHEPGIEWTIVNEATIGGNLLGISDGEIAFFQQNIESYLASIGGDDCVSIASMQEILKDPLVEALPRNGDKIQKLVELGRKKQIWGALVNTGIVEGELDEDTLVQTLTAGEVCYETLLSSIRQRTKAPRHRVEVFAETLFPDDIGLHLTAAELLSFYGVQFMGKKENPFMVDIAGEKINSEINGKLTTHCRNAAVHFESHMALRPLLRELASAGLIDMHPVLSEDIIPATITRKEDRFVFTPADNGIFPMHGIGVVTPESHIHVVPLHKMLAQPDRYEVLVANGKIFAALDVPDRLLEKHISPDCEYN